MRFLVASVAFITTACGKDAGNLDELTKIKDEICACKTQDCSNDAYDLKYSKWRDGGAIEKPSKAWMQRYDSIMLDLRKCRTEIEKLSYQ
jgi:hypothetical protein